MITSVVLGCFSLENFSFDTSDEKLMLVGSNCPLSSICAQEKEIAGIKLTLLYWSNMWRNDTVIIKVDTHF